MAKCLKFYVVYSIFRHFAIDLSKIIKIGGHLPKVLTKTNLLSFFETRCMFIMPLVKC